MSRIASDIGLAAASAVLTAFTFQMPAWTGGRGARYWLIAIIALCVVSCAIPVACNGDPKAIAAHIPLGSKLSELDKYLESFYDISYVEKWTPGVGEKTKYGSFRVQNLGAYDRWDASKAERDAFTGKLEFVHHSWVIPDDLAPSYVVSLVYVQGVLKEKNYGNLPG